MKTIRLLLLAAVIFSANIALAQRDLCRIVNDNWQNITVEFNIPTPDINTVLFDGRLFNSLSIDGLIPFSEVGAPALPLFSHLIEVPQCDGFEIRISEAEYDTLETKTITKTRTTLRLALGEDALLLMPAQPSRSKSDTTYHPLVINDKLYSTDDFYGLEPAMVESVGIARDRHLARLQFSPVRYNPVSGQLIVCRHATVSVSYRNADSEASLDLFNRYFSPHFASGALSINSLYPKSISTAAPIRYLIVAHSSFNGQLDNFVQWKRRKGFITDIVYTGSAAVGSTSSSIAAYILSQYTNATAANPAPTYLLIVGDHEQVPAFTGTTDNDHITDLYYISWTSGDNIPDCYSGRFSAQNVSQLTPQIQKTLMYEQYSFADPSFLDRAVLVAGVDGGSSGDYGYTHADPAMDYAATHYINSNQGFTQVRYFKNNTSIVPNAPGVTIASSASSNSATVRSYYNQGAGWINYSAHGSATSWGTPNFTTSHVASMTNSQKFGLMIGNCCLTNKFETTTCFGESLLRKDNYCGAVGYIGGSNSTYWYEDFYWAVGLRSSSSIGPNMSMAYNASHLGAYDRLCHTHGESYSQWALTQGAIMFVGNLAVESSSSSRKLYYWEIYHLMGDPSVMPYLTQAPQMTLSSPSIITMGTTTLSVSAAPYAYIALTDATSHSLIAATYADANGNAMLSLPSTLPLGNYELAASAQQYQTAFSPVTVIHPSGKYPTLLAISPNSDIVAGSSFDANIYLTNLGDSTAYNVSTTLSLAESSLSSFGANAILFNPSSLAIDSIPAGDTVAINCLISVASNLPDGTQILVNASSSCDDLSQPVVGNHILSVVAPVISLDLSHSSLNITPGGDASLIAVMTNTGHATFSNDFLTVSSPTRLLSVGNDISDSSNLISLAPGASASFNFSLHADSLLPSDIIVPLSVSTTQQLNNLTTQHNIFVGINPIETFENNSFHTTGWTQGAYPWTITNSGAYEGSYCLRSSSSLSHSQTAQISISVSLSSPDSISFFYKVSSETNYDKFHFLIDNNDQITTSGEVDWTRAAFLVPAGNHTLSFSYAKDGSVSRNSDCAWIDNIALPHNAKNVSFFHIDACQDDGISIAGNVINTSLPTDSTIVNYLNSNNVEITDYSVHPTYNLEQDLAVCDSLTLDNLTYSSSTDLNFAFSTVHGCDSSVLIHLTVNRSANTTIFDTAFSSPYLWNDMTITESGSYSLILSTLDGCDSTVTLFLTISDTNALAISNSQLSTLNSQLSIYPNPSSGIVNIKSSDIIASITIYNLQGIPVYSNSQLSTLNSQLSTSLPNGTYLLSVTTTNGSTSTHRLVIKR